LRYNRAMENAGEKLLEYAPPRKRRPLWLRPSLAGGALGAAVLLLWVVWAGRVYHVGAPIDGYGGLVEYLRVRHTPTGISSTWTLFWGPCAVNVGVSLAVAGGAVLAAWRLLRR
jgi:hypothetical protein